MVASDYGGQHKAATHESFSFLVADLAFCWLWNEERERVRAKFFNEKRRMSYKALNDVQRLHALSPFLTAADLIPGVLATVLVDKRYIRSFVLTPEDRLELPKGLTDWPTSVITKMMFVSHIGAMLIAGLSNEGQNVIWLTDNDDFVANDDRVIKLTPLFAGMISQYSGHGMGHFRFGTMKCDNGDLLIEDLAALPDLVCGALGEIPARGLLRKESIIQIPMLNHIPAKAMSIVRWLGHLGKALCRLTFVADEGDSAGKVRIRALEFRSES